MRAGRRCTMACDVSQALLHGYLDGELDPLRAEEFERHLESCSPCIAQLEEQESLRASLRAAKLYERAPAELAKKIERQIANTKSDSDYQWTWVPIFRWLAASAAIVLLFVITYFGAGRLLSGRSGVEQIQQAALTEVIDAHIRSLQPGHLTDVTSTDQHTVKPWFAGKLDVSPPVIDLTAQGFTLIGGRLDYLDARPIGAVVYKRRAHVINLFVAQTSNMQHRAAKTETIQGYNIRSWSDRGLNYWAISDLGADELAEFGEKLEAAAANNKEG